MTSVITTLLLMAVASLWPVLVILSSVWLLVATPAHAQVGLHFTPLPDVTVGSVTPTLVRAANGARYTLNCTNVGSISVRLGDSITVNPPTTSKGMLLLGGSSIAFTSKSALVALGVAGTATMACSEETQ